MTRELSDTWVVAQSRGGACEGSLSWQIIARFASEEEALHYRRSFCCEDQLISVMPEHLLR
jgi:hypothetical protein